MYKFKVGQKLLVKSDTKQDKHDLKKGTEVTVFKRGSYETSYNSVQRGKGYSYSGFYSPRYLVKTASGAKRVIPAVCLPDPNAKPIVPTITSVVKDAVNRVTKLSEKLEDFEYTVSEVRETLNDKADKLEELVDEV